MKKRIFIPVIVILLLSLSLISLASCATLSAEEGFQALKDAYENSVKIDEANRIYNGEIYYYKEQDRRGIETVYNPSTDSYVTVSLKNTTVNMHCYVDDDYYFHPDQDFGVYVLEDRYIEVRNSVGNMVDDYNNNVVYNARGSTVTYSEDFPMAGSSATDFDLSSAEKYGVYATLSSEAGASGVNRFLAASTGEVFGFNVLTNSDGLRGQLQQTIEGVNARDFANSATMQPYTLASYPHLQDDGRLCRALYRKDGTRPRIFAVHRLAVCADRADFRQDKQHIRLPRRLGNFRYSRRGRRSLQYADILSRSQPRLDAYGLHEGVFLL